MSWAIRLRNVTDDAGKPRPLISPLRLLFSASADQRLTPRAFMALRSGCYCGVSPSQRLMWTQFVYYGVSLSLIGGYLFWGVMPFQVPGYLSVVLMIVGLVLLALSIVVWAGPSPKSSAASVIAAYLDVGRCPSCGYTINASKAEPDRPPITCSECGSEWRHPGELPSGPGAPSRGRRQLPHE